jgi:glycosyltransferase involved in cell wall biosynthesis
MSVFLAANASREALGRTLRIAIVAPPWFSVPPRAYGGIESMVADLVDGLVERGHHVTLVGAGQPGTKAQQFIPIYPEPPSARLGEAMPEAVHAAAAAAALADLDVDVVHDHTLAGPLLARNRPTPTVTTAHGPVGGEPGDYMAWLGDTVEVVAISDAQRRHRPDINWIATVHNSVDVSTFPFGAGDGGYVLFLGRFNPDKAPHVAIDAARAAGRRIVLAGKLNEPAERRYFESEIRPRLGPGVEYVGEADALTKRQLYAGAEALLFPVCWEEPFGLVMIEAMACGTPVVALRRGSVPEIVHHGLTGLVVDRHDLLPSAIEVVGQLDRHDCREHVQRHFDAPAMVAGYEAVYCTVVEGHQILQGARPEQTGDQDLLST